MEKKKGTAPKKKAAPEKKDDVPLLNRLLLRLAELEKNAASGQK